MTHPGPLHQVHAAIDAFFADEGQRGISLAGTCAVYRLEQQFAELVGQPHALAVSSATMGLWAVFSGLDLRDADIVTTPYTWGGSLAGVVLTGNRPVFADIDRESLTLDPEQVRRAITPKTKAILAVDIYGYPCDGPALRRIADLHGLWLIQDCAQSFGAYRDGHHTGWWADAAIFSCSGGKALEAGEGGMIVTRHRELYEQVVRATQHPLRQMRDIPGLPPNEMAVNLRIHPLAAVWAEARSAAALEEVRARRAEAIRLLELLQAERVTGASGPERRCVEPSFHVLTCEPRARRNRLDRVLKDAGYDTCAPPVVEPLYAHDAWLRMAGMRGWAQAARCAVAERQSRRRVRLMRFRTDHAGRVSRKAGGVYDA